MLVSGFLGVPNVPEWLFLTLVFAALATTYIGFVTGTAGGLMLLVLMAGIFPPLVLVPIHTFVQLGATVSRSAMMLRYMLWPTLLPFVIGATLGAAIGARIFVNIPPEMLRGFMAVFILLIVWLPDFGRVGATSWRFGALGFVATFLGVFVGATGSLVSPFVAAASPDRRNFAATVATLMTCTHLLKIVAFMAIGFAVWEYVPLILAMIAGTTAGNYFGRITLDRMRERSFRLIYRILMTVLALRLAWLAYVGGPA